MSDDLLGLLLFFIAMPIAGAVILFILNKTLSLIKEDPPKTPGPGENYPPYPEN